MLFSSTCLNLANEDPAMRPISCDTRTLRLFLFIAAVQG